MTYATSFSADLLRLATQNVTVTARSSLNQYGEVQHAGSGTTFKAYVQKTSESKRTLTKDDAVIEYVVYIPSTSYSASIDDLLTFSGVTRVVVEVDVRSNEFGQQAVVLSLGAARG